MTDEEAEIRIRFGIADDRALTPEWYWRKQIEELEATQTRWVKCSERMPTVANAPEFPYVTVVNVKDKGKIISTGIVICDLQYGNLVPLGPGFLPTGWEIVAWLENIPEFVP